MKAPLPNAKPGTAGQKKIVRLGRAARSAIFFGLAVIGLPLLAYAASTSGYAWGNVAGWINFAPTDAGVAVTDSALTGYAWSANDGWINFSPSQGGVTNDGAGSLGGFAWDQSAGWVSFSGVSITSSGRLHGEATGANGYIINFDCTNCDVQTSWRPTPAASPGAISPVYAAPPANAPEPPPALAYPAPSATSPSYTPGASSSGAGDGALSSIVSSLGSHTGKPGASLPASTTHASSTATSTTRHAVALKGVVVVGGISILALLALALWIFL